MKDGRCTVCGYNGRRDLHFLDSDGSERVEPDWKDVAEVMENGLYAVHGDYEFANPITIQGTVELVLCNDTELIANRGIVISEGSRLIIYGQAKNDYQDPGVLNAQGLDSAGIGGKKNKSGGQLEIYGGNIYAKGSGENPGIGAAYNGSMELITIGGNSYVEAKGGSNSAGIGGGKSSKAVPVIINGATVVAEGGTYGSGIGSGRSGETGYVIIRGGTVTATGRGGGAGIGSSYRTDTGSETITIEGGKVYATGRGNGAGIGSGKRGNCDLTVDIFGGEVFAISRVNADDIGNGAGIGGGDEHYASGGEGGTVHIHGGLVVAEGKTAIGHGGNDWKMGTLTIDDHMKVRAGKDANSHTLIAASSRVSACNSNKYARIEVCDHEGHGYTSDETGHRIKCDACYSYFYQEEHTFGADNTCKVCGYQAASSPQFRTHSLVLTGNIAINFYMYLPQMPGVDYSNSYMEFLGNWPVQRDNFDPEDRDYNGMGYYGFTCELNSIQMAEPIMAVFHYGDGQTVRSMYSVEKYIAEFDDKLLNSADETTTALVHAIADYGHYAQIALSKEHKWNLGTDYAELQRHYRNSFDYDEVFEATKGYPMTRILDDPMAKAAPVTLNLLSKTELCVTAQYEDYVAGDVTVTVDGAPAVIAALDDHRFLVQTADIPANLLDEEHTFVFTTKTGTVTVTTSPLGYIHEVLDKSSSRVDMDAVCTMYYYYKATLDYRNAQGY